MYPSLSVRLVNPRAEIPSWDLIQKIIEAHRLIPHGFAGEGRTAQSDPWTDYDRQTVTDAIPACLAWLEAHDPRGQVVQRTQWRGSYGLKHEIEDWAGRYVPNVAVFIASLHLAIPLKRVKSYGPNALVKVCRGTRTLNS